MKRSYLPGAEVWSDPRAEQILDRINETRRICYGMSCYGMSPLAREKTSTEDVIRERLRDQDRFDRWMRRRRAQ
jgi:hypothetical protein